MFRVLGRSCAAVLAGSLSLHLALRRGEPASRALLDSGTSQSVLRQNPLGVGGMDLHQWVFELEAWRKQQGQELWWLVR